VDLIITELAVFEIKNSKLWLKELFAPYDIQTVIEKTGCGINLPEKIRKIAY